MPTPTLEKLGKYRITEVLGEGQMGVVYKGFDPDIQRVVALKTIRRQGEGASEFADTAAARFRNEAQAVGRLQHPGIVAVYEYGEDQGTAFIAMEFVEGNNLASYLSGQVRFTDADILSLICQLLDALQHAHELGVWHRDIKPANLIMTRAGRLKVADFGIARIESAGLTQASLLIGTPSYMAPEQFLGTRIDRRVDIYGAGVLLYQLLTGRQPFTGSTESLMYKVVNEPVVPPSQAEGGAHRPRGYDAIVGRALAKDPAQRFASAAEFRAAVLAAVDQAVSPTVSDATVVAVRPSRPGSGQPAAIPTQGSAGGSSGHPPTHWEPKLLQQVEHTLARHVGPMAGVMVRRAARDCDDLDTLVAKLAEQVSNAAARTAFLGQAAQSGHGRHGASAAAPASGSPAADGGAISEALRERAERALAHHVGPIARILVRKAAAGTTQRAQFVARLAEAITDAAQRKKFIAEIERLL